MADPAFGGFEERKGGESLLCPRILSSSFLANCLIELERIDSINPRGHNQALYREIQREFFKSALLLEPQ
jgi:hypothetical protein